MKNNNNNNTQNKNPLQRSDLFVEQCDHPRPVELQRSEMVKKSWEIVNLSKGMANGSECVEF